MKKSILVFYVMLLVLLIACTQSPQQKPIQPNNNQEMSQSDESSIFEEGTIEKIKIIKDNAEVRAGFSNRYPIIETLNKGDVIDVLGQQNDWYVVQLVNNYLGSLSIEDAVPIVVEEPYETDPSIDEEEQPEEIPDVEGEPDIDDEPNIDQTPDGIIPRTTDENIVEKPNVNLTNQEGQMLRLINKERAKNDLPPLIADAKVTRIARIKSQDMVDNNYFSHNSPTYGSPFDMMDEFGIKYIYAGENIAGNSTVVNAHNALMNSSGHKKNILHSKFTHIGIGIKRSDRYGLIFTQMFISKPK